MIKRVRTFIIRRQIEWFQHPLIEGFRFIDNQAFFWQIFLVNAPGYELIGAFQYHGNAGNRLAAKYFQCQICRGFSLEITAFEHPAYDPLAHIVH